MVNKQLISCRTQQNFRIRPTSAPPVLSGKSVPRPANLINSSELLDKIIDALDAKRSLSVVSMGATETFVMAQYTLFDEDEIMGHPEAVVANRGEQRGFNHRGIRFPNRAARDQAVEAVSNADIVGYNTLIEPASNLTESVLKACGIRPAWVFEANLRRVIMFSQPDRFQTMLRGRRLLLIGSQAPMVKKVLQDTYQEKLACRVVGAIPIYEYEELTRVLNLAAGVDFDLCLLAAGVNALILAPMLARLFGKVAFDIGWGMESMATGRVVLDQWLSYLIGMDNIMLM